MDDRCFTFGWSRPVEAAGRSPRSKKLDNNNGEGARGKATFTKSMKNLHKLNLGPTSNPESMRRFVLTASALLLVQVPALFAQKVDLRNYAVGGYDANPNEMRVAERRASRYWQKNGSRIGDKARYLAIEAASVIPGDVVQPLWQNMINAQTGSGFLLPTAWDLGKMHCVMIYDPRISSFVTKRGFLVMETPHPGTLARFGDYIALYIRTGSFW
jgi:hypothetical protein